MAYNTKNIIHGAAAIYYSVDSSLDAGWDDVEIPEYVAATSFAETLEAANDWHHVGLTREGVDVEYSPEFKDVTVDQLLDAAEVYKTSQTMTVNTTLVEATLEHLLFVWGLSNEQLVDGGGTPEWAHGPSTPAAALPATSSEIGIYEGALGEAPVERQLAFVGPGPLVNTERVYHIRRALQVEAVSHGLKRDDETVFPASFRCLPDTRASFRGAGYGTIRERATV